VKQGNIGRIQCHQKATLPLLKLNLEFIELMGLSIDELGIPFPSFEVMVPLREEDAELFTE